MCGIIGIYNFKQKNVINKRLLKQMTDIVKYRGPDDSGLYVDEYVGLGHRRLSIIDLSKRAKQPMSNENEDVFIVYNGEVYNFKELKPELEQKGHKFKSDSDTEVILHLYEEYGEQCVEYIKGMFAFAIWDIRNKTLFLARDRIGKKPLFYYLDDNKLVFASELKSILLDKTIKREIDFEAMSHYLTYGYIPNPWSIFKNIKKLSPAHHLVCNKGKITVKKYWDLKYKPEHKSLPYFKKKILQELERAVKLRLISDVPLGVFLSGGIDSSAIVAMMAKNMEEPVKTFSIGFEEEQYNELKYAKIIAERFKTDHKEFIVKPDMIKILPKLVWHYNEPYADSSAVPTYYVSELTRKYVTVALNGDGGDESFAGYTRYTTDAYASRIPSFLRKTATKFSKIIPYTKFRILNYVRRGLDVVSLDPVKRYFQIQTFFDYERWRKNMAAMNALKIDSSFILKKYFERCNSNSFTNKKMYVDVKTYLPDDLMVKVDIASMANSLEARSPFLDVDLMEFAASIPPGLKLKGVTKKFILKKAFYPILPKKILHRSKMGFGVPIDKWFKGELKSLMYDLLLSKEAKSRGYFKYDKIKDLLDKHASGKVNECYRIWNLVWLELWHKIYIDNEFSKAKLNFKCLM